MKGWYFEDDFCFQMRCINKCCILQHFQAMQKTTETQKEEINSMNKLLSCIIDCENEAGFEKITGQDQTIEHLKTALEKIVHFKELIELKIVKPHSGVLLYGPSGIDL